MSEIDITNVKAEAAYRDEESGRCRLNSLICADGDCRRCNFVIDGSLMLTLDTICHELAHIKALLGNDEGCDCGCGCDGCE